MNREKAQQQLGLKDVDYYYFDNEGLAHKLTGEKLVEIAHEKGLKLFENIFMKVESVWKEGFREIEDYIIMAKHSERIMADDEQDDDELF